MFAANDFDNVDVMQLGMCTQIATVANAQTVSQNFKSVEIVRLMISKSVLYEVLLSHRNGRYS